jgi:hypothetical protein
MIIATLLACAPADGSDKPQGEPGHADLRVENDYSDSLFTVWYQTDADSGFVLDDERIDGSDYVELADAINLGGEETDVEFRVETLSLGKPHVFRGDTPVEEGQMLVMEYTYDLATAEFTLFSEAR